MKIGFSLGRCIRDIVLEKVSFDDVLVIISRTRIEDTVALRDVVRNYLLEPTYLKGLDPDACYDVAQRLWDAAKLHQPRMHGVHPTMVINDYVWMDAVPTSTEATDSVLDAWKAYRTMLVLGTKVPDMPS